jgi:hypothetical protein
MRRIPAFFAILFLSSIYLSVNSWGVVLHCVSNETELQNALIAAQANGDEDIIRIGQNTYFGNFTFDSSEGQNITLLGGYTTVCGIRVLEPSNTVLDGENKGHALKLINRNGGDIYVEGIRLRNGSGVNEGGGLFAQSYSDSGPSGSITINKNDFYSSIMGLYSWINHGHILDSNPRFLDPRNLDYHLKNTSPCIDRGGNSAPSIPLVDFDGSSRIVYPVYDGNMRVDIGAYEFVRFPILAGHDFDGSGNSDAAVWRFSNGT